MPTEILDTHFFCDFVFDTEIDSDDRFDDPDKNTNGPGILRLGTNQSGRKRWKKGKTVRVNSNGTYSVK